MFSNRGGFVPLFGADHKIQFPSCVSSFILICLDSSHSFFSTCQFLNFLLRCRHNQFPHVLTTEVFILRASLFEMQKLEWNWCAVRNETCCSSVCPSVQFQTSGLIIPILSFITLTMNALKCCHFAFPSLLLTIFNPRVCFYSVS